MDSPPVLRLHPEAESALNLKAEEVLGAFEIGSPPVSGATPVASDAARPIAAQISSGPGVYIDPMIQYMEHGGRIVGLTVAAPAGIRRLSQTGCDQMKRVFAATAKGLDGPTCTAYVESTFAKWTRERLCAGLDAQWTHYFRKTLAADAAQRTVYIPLAGISIDVLFSIGGVRIGFFDDTLLEKLTGGPPGPERELRKEKVRSEFRKRFLGRVYAAVSVVSDKDSAIEFAKGLAEEAVNALRFVHLAAFDATFPCALAVARTEFMEVDRAIVETGQGLSLYSQAARTGPPTVVNAELLEAMRALGLTAIDAHLSREHRSELQDSAWSALSIFARGVAQDAPTDRLLHALVAVESLLLRTDSEPVSGSLALRMAHLVTTGLENRRQVQEDLKSAYAVRSRFVHHGKMEIPPEKLEAVNRTLGNIRLVILAALTSPAKDAAEFARALDDRILS